MTYNSNESPDLEMSLIMDVMVGNSRYGNEMSVSLAAVQLAAAARCPPQQKNKISLSRQNELKIRRRRAEQDRRKAWLQRCLHVDGQ
jgi:hypothetical protein